MINQSLLCSYQPCDLRSDSKHQLELACLHFQQLPSNLKPTTVPTVSRNQLDCSHLHGPHEAAVNLPLVNGSTKLQNGVIFRQSMCTCLNFKPSKKRKVFFSVPLNCFFHFHCSSFFFCYSSYSGCNRTIN